MKHSNVCPICSNTDFSKEFEYRKPPKGEIRFDFSKFGRYYRKVLCCNTCGHFISTYKIDQASLYAGEYAHSNYQDADGMKRAFERIISLDPLKSDNKGRVQRIVHFADNYFAKENCPGHIPEVLDVGSGLGVFPFEMKKAGWVCTALDPDKEVVGHIKKNVGVKVIHGDFLKVNHIGNYDVVTFNKVLEHVEYPEKMLEKARSILRIPGFIYIEVPDGEMAVGDGKEREEFCIDHIHMFSFASVALLAKKAGFVPLLVERLREPSTKYTLRAFCIV